MANQAREQYPIEIEPIKGDQAEVEEMGALGKRAFGPNGLMHFCFHQNNDSGQDLSAARTRQHMERIKDPQFVYRKAVDPSKPNRPIIGAAVWYRQMNPQNEKPEDPWGPWPEGVHLECLDACLGILRRWRANYFREKNTPYLYLLILEVDPDYQRKGVGSALLRDGLKQADAENMPAFLEATPAGLELYKRFGWEEKEASIVNLKDFGGHDESFTTVALVRPGQGSK